MSETQRRIEWTKENTTRFGLKLQNSTDADIIERLKQQESMQGYIKELIRRDIESSK
jgi:hypothetical protein